MSAATPEYRPCSAECNGCPTCDPGLSERDEKDEREALVEVAAQAISDWRTGIPGHARPGEADMQRARAVIDAVAVRLVAPLKARLAEVEAERDRALAWEAHAAELAASRLTRVSALIDKARRAVEQTNTTCRCPDEPHQNLLHDIAHDLAALPSAERAEAERDRLQTLINQGSAGAMCPDLRTHVERVQRIVAEAERAEADLAAAEQRALYAARDALYRGEGPDLVADADIVYGEWLGNRADRLATQATNDNEEGAAS